MPQFTIANTGEQVMNVPVRTILNNLGGQGIQVQSVCGGRGNCGTCRFQIVEGGKYLTPINETERNRLGKSIEHGWRLACQTASLRDLTLRLPPYYDKLQQAMDEPQAESPDPD